LGPVGDIAGHLASWVGKCVAERSAEIDGPTDGEAVAWAEDLCKVYGTGDAQVVALDHVTVELGRGRLTAIMGPQGPASPR
jgi:putative ABC transport system ATP-binding protein